VIVRPRVAGTIKAIYVKQGDYVRKGQLIAQLDDTKIKLRLEQDMKKLEQARWELRLLKKGAREEEKTKAKEKVEQAKAKMQYAKNQLERIKKLYDAKLVSKDEHERAKREYEIAKRGYKMAQSELNLILSGAREEEVALASAKVKELKARVSLDKFHLENAKIYAPISGIITTQDLEQMVSKFLDEGSELMSIARTDKLLLKIKVPEKEIIYVKSGLKIELKTYGMPEETFYSAVKEIEPVVYADSKYNFAIVKGTLENSSGMLKPGMGGRAKIACGRKSLLFIWTRKLIRLIRIEVWWLW
jgi:HlyD family secretion protein